MSALQSANPFSWNKLFTLYFQEDTVQHLCIYVNSEQLGTCPVSTLDLGKMGKMRAWLPPKTGGRAQSLVVLPTGSEVKPSGDWPPCASFPEGAAETNILRDSCPFQNLIFLYFWLLPPIHSLAWELMFKSIILPPTPHRQKKEQAERDLLYWHKKDGLGAKWHSSKYDLWEINILNLPGMISLSKGNILPLTSSSSSSSSSNKTKKTFSCLLHAITVDSPSAKN